MDCVIRSGESVACPRILHAASIVWLVGLMGCAAAGAPGANPMAIDLSARFHVPAENASRTFEPHVPVYRSGKQRDAMVLIAPATIRGSLAGASGRVTLEGWATPVFNLGDGFQMDIFLVDGARSSRIFSRYFDAGRSAADRDWIPISVPMDLGESADPELVITLSAGPQGDLVCDWLALSALRLVQGASRP